MTRNGKIARLPRELREELNRRLQNGEVGKSLVEWLNSRPEVQSVMASEFGGQPINEPNLTQWKGGGYEDWLAEQESLSEVRLLLEETGEVGKLGAEELTQRLALWLTVRCAVEARKQRASGADPDLGAFGRLCRGLSSLRRGEQAERRLKIEEARLKLEEKRLELSRGEGSETLEKMFWEWTERPDIKKKLRPRPLTKKQQMKRIRDIYGIGTYEEAPRVTTRRQIGNRLFEIETRMKELNEQKVELERRKAEEDRREAEEAQSAYLLGKADG